MAPLVLKTGLRKRGGDGREAVVYVDGDKRSGEERWAEIKALPHPATELGTEILLENGSEIRLPFNDLPWILPDRTGVLVLFEPGKYTNSDGSDVFAEPNNAAIYNADGSLRFQLIIPDVATPGWRIGGIHSGTMPEKFNGMLGVVVATHPDAYPEWVYAVDPASPALIPVHQWVRW